MQSTNVLFSINYLLFFTFQIRIMKVKKLVRYWSVLLQCHNCFALFAKISVLIGHISLVLAFFKIKLLLRWRSYREIFPLSPKSTITPPLLHIHPIAPDKTRDTCILLPPIVSRVAECNPSDAFNIPPEQADLLSHFCVLCPPVARYMIYEYKLLSSSQSTSRCRCRHCFL